MIYSYLFLFILIVNSYIAFSVNNNTKAVRYTFLIEVTLYLSVINSAIIIDLNTFPA